MSQQLFSRQARIKAILAPGWQLKEEHVRTREQLREILAVGSEHGASQRVFASELFLQWFEHIGPGSPSGPASFHAANRRSGFGGFGYGLRDCDGSGEAEDEQGSAFGFVGAGDLAAVVLHHAVGSA